MCFAGPMVKHFGLQGLNDMGVHSLGYKELHPSASMSEANNAVRETADNSHDSAHALWKQMDKQYLRPFLGGRSSGQPHLYELNVNDTEDAEVNQEAGVSPQHVLEMQSSGMSQVEYDLPHEPGSGNVYQPPPASVISDLPNTTQTPLHRNQVGRSNSGLPHDHAEDT